MNFYKTTLLLIVLFVICYQIFLNYKKNSIVNLAELNNTDRSEKVFRLTKRVKKSKLINNDNMNNNTSVKKINSNKFIHPELGIPDKVLSDDYIYYNNIKSPWSTIIYNKNKDYNYKYIIDFKILDNHEELLNEWKKIIPNLEFNTSNNKISIPSKNEESALAIINLIVNSLLGNLTLDNIIKENLIPISISKILKFPSLKNKFREQIIDNILEKKDNNLVYKEDLATNSEETQDIDIKHPQLNIKNTTQANDQLADMEKEPLSYNDQIDNNLEKDIIEPNAYLGTSDYAYL